LVAFHDPFGNVGKLHAAVLDTAIAGVRARESVLQLKFEIGGPGVAPDAEDVLRGLVIGPGFAYDGAIFHAPEIRVAVPALHTLAVEDRAEAGFFQSRDHIAASAAAASATGLPGLLAVCGRQGEYAN